MWVRKKRLTGAQAYIQVVFKVEIHKGETAK